MPKVFLAMLATSFGVMGPGGLGWSKATLIRSVKAVFRSAGFWGFSRLGGYVRVVCYHPVINHGPLIFEFL